MPIGEDLPMLIPISILITVIVLFIFGVYTNMTEQDELIRMSQISLDTIDYTANIMLSDGSSNLEYSFERFNTSRICHDMDYKNITVNYKVKINVSDSDTGRSWCWDNYDNAPEEESIVNTIPIMIINGSKTDLGEVTVSVGK